MVDETTVNYEAMTADELMEAIGQAYASKDLSLMKTLLKLHNEKEKAEEKAKKDALLAELVKTTQTVTDRINKVIDKMVEEGLLDGAEGVWYARDFGEKEEKGINPACRLVKTKRTSSGGGSSGKSSYTANPAKSADLLNQVGDEVYFAEDTTVTIDKKEIVMPAGMTYKEAYDFSTNGGWRNRVRMALLKKAGVI
jgi:hypothetical protein